MKQYVVSARKYRPSGFNDVVGQGHITETLKNAISSDQVAHAFLFTGPRGVGKTTCARILAKVLNCENPTDKSEACNTCSSCTSLNENASFNILELDAASNNSVDHIRTLIEQVRFQPQSGKYKVFIIDEVHMLSTSAFNAFLKTLEEPPPHVIFILATTEKHKIIPTILSRCQVFDFKSIQHHDIISQLTRICSIEKISFEKEALHIIAEKAEGAMRDALSIFDRVRSSSGDNSVKYEDVLSSLNILDYDYYFQITDALMAQDLSSILLIYDEISRNGFEGEVFIIGLSEHFRNLLIIKDPKTLSLLDKGQAIELRYKNQSELTSRSFLLTALDILNQTDIHYAKAINKQLHVEIALCKLSYINSRIENVGNAETLKKKILHPSPRSPLIKEISTKEPPVLSQKTSTSPKSEISSLNEKKKLVDSLDASTPRAFDYTDIQNEIRNQEQSQKKKSKKLDSDKVFRGDFAPHAPPY